MNEHEAPHFAGYRRVTFPVDSARFVVLHPLDFRKRLREEGGSLLSVIADGDLDEEFEGGKLLGLSLGADGARGLLIGPHPPTDEVAARLADEPPFDFRLDVSRGGFFVGDPTHEDRFRRRKKAKLGAPDDDDDDDDAGEPSAGPYVPYARGRYHARLFTVNPAVDVGASWVLTLDPVDDFEGLPAWRDLPSEADTRRSPGAKRVSTSGLEPRVRHPKFGVGRVLSREGTGPSAKLHVAFEEGEKRLLASFVTELDAAEP